MNEYEHRRRPGERQGVPRQRNSSVRRSQSQSQGEELRVRTHPDGQEPPMIQELLLPTDAEVV